MQVVPQILSGFKIQHFSGDGTDKKVPHGIDRNTPFQSKKINFFWGGV